MSSILSAEQKRELVKAKDKELSTFFTCSVVEAASRQGISPSALMKMLWVVTFKDDGSLRARLVVQGFTDRRLGKIPTSSPTASRRSRQIFLTLASSLGLETHKRNVTCAFLQGDLDEQYVDDADDDDNFKLSQHNQFSTHSVNKSPSYLENCNWSIICVFDCKRPCTVLSMLQDGTTVLRLIFETSKVRNPSWNPVCGLSDMKTVSFMLCLRKLFF